MKKRNLILIFLISLFVLPICVSAELNCNEIGCENLDFDTMDVNKDGYVGEVDMQILRYHMANIDETVCVEGICDFDANDAVNMKDLLILREWIYTGGGGKYDISKYDVNGDGYFELFGNFKDSNWNAFVESAVFKEALNISDDDTTDYKYEGDDEAYFEKFSGPTAYDIAFDDMAGRFIMAGLVSDNGRLIAADIGDPNLKDVLRTRKGIVKEDLIETSETTDNPKTGVFFKYGIVALLALLASAGLVISRKNNKFPRIG